jgi:hypothetical protein
MKLTIRTALPCLLLIGACAASAAPTDLSARCDAKPFTLKKPIPKPVAAVKPAPPKPVAQAAAAPKTAKPIADCKTPKK